MIIALEDAKYKLIGMREDIEDLGSALRIEELRTLAAELDAQTLDPDFWSNQENSSTILQKLKQTKDTIENYEALKAKLEDAITLAEMAIEENDESYVEEVESELAEISKLAEDEESIARLMLDQMNKNAAIGYEAANHYYFSRGQIAEKILNCRKTIEYFTERSEK